MGKRKTNEEFVKEVYNLVSDNFIFLEEYKGSGTKIKCRHNICNYEWGIRPNDFLNGKRCPSCYGNNKKTNEEFAENIREVWGQTLSIIGEYKGNNTPILVVHNSCGYEWEPQAGSLLRKKIKIKGGGCPLCSKKNKWDNNRLTKTIKDKKLTYDIIGEVKGVDYPVLIRNTKCGHEFSITPWNFSNNDECRICIDPEEVFFKKFKNKFDIKCKKENNKIDVLCLTCGYVNSDMNISGFNYSNGYCPRCSNKEQINDKEYVKRLNEKFPHIKRIEPYKGQRKSILHYNTITNIEFYSQPCSVLGGISLGRVNQWDTKSFQSWLDNRYGFLIMCDEYPENSKTKVKFYNKTYDTYFYTRPNDIVNGKSLRGLKGKISQGESKVLLFLEKMGLEYEFQKPIKINSRKHIFDFYIGILNKNLYIEYDGEQHFRPVRFGGMSDDRARENFKQQKINDQIKNDYCFENNIPLLRIPYWESENIEHILFDFLVEHGALEEITV